MLRLATYNVEWFDHLFDDDGRLRDDGGGSGRQGVSRAEQIAGLCAVFRALDADGIMVIEAPDQNRRRSSVRALEHIAAHCGIRSRRAVSGFATETQQEIAFLYDPDRLAPRHDPQGDPTGKKGHRAPPRFDGVFRIDLNSDGVEDLVTWSKPPLELAVRIVGGAGRELRLIGVHAKSKAPHGARTPDEAMRISIENRRKQLAQCVWLRARVEQHLAAGESVIVMGDFNDGPGLDEYEALFGRSGVEVVTGEAGPGHMYDPHVVRALTRRFTAPPTTARFTLPDGEVLSALLDYIMVSADLRALRPRWHIWHPFDNAACFADPGLRDALIAASDHFPVTLEIDL